MRRRLAGLLLLCSVLCIAQDHAEHLSTGTSLRDACSRRVSVNDEKELAMASLVFGQCDGFLEAVIQINELVPNSHLFCPPSRVTYGQVQEIVIKYLNDHPEQLHLFAADLTIKALRKEFPCPAKKGPGG